MEHDLFPYYATDPPDEPEPIDDEPEPCDCARPA